MQDRPVITISGSYRKHLDRILVAKRRFEELGAVVLRPHTEQVAGDDGGLVRLHGDPLDAAGVQQAQFDAITRSDLIYVVNPGGYVGPSATAEVGYAHRAGTPVVSAEPPFEDAVGAIVAAVGSPDEALHALPRRDAA